MVLAEQEKLITLRDVKVNFGDYQVLNGINLDVYRGDIIGYIGPNGAGKSTTIKIILGMIEDFTGEVEVLGEPLQKGSSDYTRRIGYVPERSDMYDQLTPREYLSFIGTLYGMDKQEAKEKAFHMLRLLNMEEVFDQRINSFSKGMRQKVLIISSLLHNPDILFWDEPLNGLDSNSVSIIKDMIRKLAANGKTFFFISHIMEIVEMISNRIILLSEGEIAADESVSTLKANNQQASLEGVFNQLTGFEEQELVVDSLVDCVLDGKGESHE
jgi:ABC-2 type transport system ATP-binding protein